MSVYHPIDDANSLLVCPGCESPDLMYIHPTDKTHSSWMHHEMREALYTPGYHEHVKQMYTDKWGVAPKPEHRHFICPSCLDKFYEEDKMTWPETFYDSLPVYPYHALDRIKASDLKDIQDVKYNPLDTFFK